MKTYISQEMKRYNHLLGEIDSIYHESSLKLGITDSVSKILYTICIVGNSCLLNDICKRTGLSKQTVNSALRKLEDENIIYLEAVNGKSKKVCLTENGITFSQKTAWQIIKMENDIFDSWSHEDVKKYLELTEKYLSSLKERIHEL